MSRAPRTEVSGFRARAWFALGVLGLGAMGLVVRAVELQLVDREFLIGQGEARAVREVRVEAHRGAILDRNGLPLAISTPVESVYANPGELKDIPERWPELARALKRNRTEFARRITASQGDFLWLARHLTPAEAHAVQKLNVPGVYLRSEYRRYYPAGEVLGHVLGVTDQDDQGLEALELAFDPWLAGVDGFKRVIRDNNGRRVDDIENIRAVREGRDLALSVDTRMQYLAYRELKRAIDDNRAVSGSMVLIDITTGEVLAMVNQPTFNPNDRGQRARALNDGWLRNRAVTDMLEPGSSFKPFVIAAALESGRFDQGSVIDTGSSGVYEFRKVEVKDEHPQGVLDLAGILAKSSNIGMAKIAWQLEEEQLWSTLTRFGFGQVTASRFPGESAGSLPAYSNWRPVTVSSLSRGYNLSVTPLQLAQAYAAVGALGVTRPVSLLRVDQPEPGKRVMSERNARTLITLLEAVVKDGTGSRAAIPGYRVAGKTGTARKVKPGGGYYTDRYTAVFGGVAPAGNPRLAAVIVIDDPRADRYYGGEIAAPVFSAVVGGALRLMGVAPDATLDGAPDPLSGVGTVVSR